MTPEEALASANPQFEEWAKRFPERAATARATVAKKSASKRTSDKLAAGNVPPVLEVPQAERESLVRIAEMGKPVPLPTPEELGVSDAQWLAALRKAGVSDKEVDDALISADTAERFKAALAGP
jgi:hypothetical protein